MITTLFNKLKSYFKRKHNTKIALVLPKSPINLQGFYLQVTLDTDDGYILTTKHLNSSQENLRWIKFPDKYCGSITGCVVSFKETTFVTATYLYWLLQLHLKKYSTAEEFFNNVKICGAMNNDNLNYRIKLYYETYKNK